MTGEPTMTYSMRECFEVAFARYPKLRFVMFAWWAANIVVTVTADIRSFTFAMGECRDTIDALSATLKGREHGL
jgi:hypothetical protein